MNVQLIGLDLIDPPGYAHRVDIDEKALYELADSIKTIGLRQAIEVRPREGGRYEIISGHRRYLAHVQLRLPNIRAVVTDADDVTTERLRATENLQRENLSPMEEARAMGRLSELDNLNAEQLAHKLSRSVWWVEHRLALLALPDDLQELVHTKELSASHGMLLAEIDDEQHRRYLTRYALEGGASVAVMREWVRQYQVSKEYDPQAEAPKPEIPAPGQPVVIMMPCFTCGDTIAHTALHIVRVCTSCQAEIVKNSGG